MGALRRGAFVWARTTQTSDTAFVRNWIGMKFYVSRHSREENSLDRDIDCQLDLHINSTSLPSTNPTMLLRSRGTNPPMRQSLRVGRKSVKEAEAELTTECFSFLRGERKIIHISAEALWPQAH